MSYLTVQGFLYLSSPPTPSSCQLDCHLLSSNDLIANDNVLHWLPLSKPGDKTKALGKMERRPGRRQLGHLNNLPWYPVLTSRTRIGPGVLTPGSGTELQGPEGGLSGWGWEESRPALVRDAVGVAVLSM